MKKIQAYPFLISLSLLLPFCLAGCGDSTPSPGASAVPSDTLFAMSDSGTIYLVHGNGGDPQRVIGGGYNQATLSPDRTKIACVHPGDFYITVYSLNAQGEPEGKPKAIYNFDALHTQGEVGNACCPLWSPDGNKIYFMNQSYLAVYDYQARKTSILLDLPEGETGDELSHIFPKDGNTLYAVTHDWGGLKTIWSIDLGNNQATSIVSVQSGYYQSFQFPPDSVPVEAYQALYGSKEHPVLEPVIPSGDRFYFYPGKKESTFETAYLALGYDKTQNSQFVLSTLDTDFHLFSKGRTDYIQY